MTSGASHHIIIFCVFFCISEDDGDYSRSSELSLQVPYHIFIIFCFTLPLKNLTPRQLLFVAVKKSAQKFAVFSWRYMENVINLPLCLVPVICDLLWILYRFSSQYSIYFSQNVCGLSIRFRIFVIITTYNRNPTPLNHHFLISYAKEPF